jgi:hypothetical protein
MARITQDAQTLWSEEGNKLHIRADGKLDTIRVVPPEVYYSTLECYHQELGLEVNQWETAVELLRELETEIIQVLNKGALITTQGEIILQGDEFTKFILDNKSSDLIYAYWDQCPLVSKFAIVDLQDQVSSPETVYIPLADQEDPNAEYKLVRYSFGDGIDDIIDILYQKSIDNEWVMIIEDPYIRNILSGLTLTPQDETLVAKTTKQTTKVNAFRKGVFKSLGLNVGARPIFVKPNAIAQIRHNPDATGRSMLLFFTDIHGNPLAANNRIGDKIRIIDAFSERLRRKFLESGIDDKFILRPQFIRNVIYSICDQDSQS